MTDSTTLAEKPILTEKDIAGLFPLKLSPFEFYFLKEQNPDYPQVLLRQLTFSGEVNRGALEKALRVACSRHPLFKSLIDTTSFRHPAWIAAPGLSPRIDWGHGDGSPDMAEPDFLDLTKELGLRLWVRRGSDHTLLTFLMHHACTDGIGALIFIRDLLIAYAREINPEANLKFPDLRLDLLPTRSNFPSSYFNLSKLSLWDLKHIVKFFKETPAEIPPAPPSKGKNGSKAVFPRLISHVLQASQVKDLKTTAQQLGVTLNDVLLYALFLTLRNWNHQHLREDPHRTLRILMPINLREGDMKSLPAVNFISNGFISAQEKECRREGNFLKKIHRDTTHEINSIWPGVFLKGLGIAAKRPIYNKFLKKRKSFKVTAILSNLGEITQSLGYNLPRQNGRIVAGNLTLEGIRGCPPLSDKTHFAVHVMTYAGNMTVAATSNPKALSLQDTHRLLEMLIGELVQAAGDLHQSDGF